MKKILSFALTFMLLSTIQNLSAQHDSIELKEFKPLDTFRLERYALPELKYKSLSMDFDFSTSANKSSFTLFEENIYSENYSISPVLAFNNYCYFNNKKRQIIGSDNLLIDYHFKNVEKFLSDEDSSYYNFGGFLSSNRNFSFYNGNTFIDLSPQFNYYYRNYSGKDFSDFEAKLGVLVGKGRIEDVTDAWHVIRILKDLEREKLLTRIPDGSEIIEIAEILTKSRYKRIFDYRLMRKQIQEDMDKILTDKGLITDKNLNYYMSVFDMLQYGVNTRRFANSKFAIGLVSAYSFHNLYQNENTDVDYNLAMEAKYTIYKPVNMSLDFYFNSFVDFGYTTNASELFGIYFDDYYINPSISTSLTKYISSRANASAGISSHYLHKFGDSSGEKNIFDISFDGQIKYYFSPRTNLSCNLTMNYLSDIKGGVIFISHFKYQEGFGYDFRINLTHLLY